MGPVTEGERIKKAADAMFHKLFRLFGRRERATAAEIEEEARLALEAAQEDRSDPERYALEPFGPAFDCAEDARRLL